MEDFIEPRSFRQDLSASFERDEEQYLRQLMLENPMRAATPFTAAQLREHTAAWEWDRD